MRAFFKKGSLLSAIVLTCMLVGGSVSALAVPKAQVLREVAGGFHTGTCCSLWDESISVNLSDGIVPVLVTWSMEYQANAPFLVGLSLNGGGCTFFGPPSIPTFESADDTNSSRTFQWVLMPGDFGLIKGVNTVRLCGGGVFADTDRITIGFNTLAAQVRK